MVLAIHGVALWLVEWDNERKMIICHCFSCSPQPLCVVLLTNLNLNFSNFSSSAQGLRTLMRTLTVLFKLIWDDVSRWLSWLPPKPLRGMNLAQDLSHLSSYGSCLHCQPQKAKKDSILNLEIDKRHSFVCDCIFCWVIFFSVSGPSREQHMDQEKGGIPHFWLWWDFTQTLEEMRFMLLTYCCVNSSQIWLMREMRKREEHLLKRRGVGRSPDLKMPTKESPIQQQLKNQWRWGGNEVDVFVFA